MLVKYSHTHFKVTNKNVTCIEDRKLKQDYSNLLLVTQIIQAGSILGPFGQQYTNFGHI